MSEQPRVRGSSSTEPLGNRVIALHPPIGTSSNVSRPPWTSTTPTAAETALYCAARPMWATYATASSPCGWLERRLCVLLRQPPEQVNHMR